MKRIVLALLIISLLFSSGGEVLAAVYKPPAAICFTWEGFNFTMALTMKAMGKTTMADGSTQFYAINGVLFAPQPTEGPPWSAPLGGTGYMSKGQNNQIFNFSVAGSSYLLIGNGFQQVWGILGYWDVVTGNGFLTYVVSEISGNYPGSCTIQAVVCNTQAIP